MSRFGPDPLAFFQSVYKDIAPWDTGAPQPAMVALLEKYPPPGPVLDLGCGTGDLAIYLAQLGQRVLGIDFVESAIRDALRKRDSLDPKTARLLDFQVADALKPSLLQKEFGAVLDSGFCHLFDSDQCDALANEVASTLLPRGRYYLHEFAIEYLVPNVPRRITSDELQARFTTGNGWRILEIQSVAFLTRGMGPVPAICACIERLPAEGVIGTGG